MCELLGMSANIPTDICFSFSGLMRRGGDTGPHRDGWGLTFYEGKGCRTFKDPHPSHESKIAKLLEQYPIKSCAVVGHIRQANRGPVCLENTHPFTRELWGKNWTYAHNGQLKGYEVLPIGRHQPIGETDSEWLFCHLLDALEAQFETMPSVEPLAQFIQRKGQTIQPLGVVNFILTEGEHLFAFCSNHLHWITRKAPFGKATLIDNDWEIDFQQETTEKDVVSIIATQPLTCNEQWHQLQSGELIVFHQGNRIDFTP